LNAKLAKPAENSSRSLFAVFAGFAFQPFVRVFLAVRHPTL